MRQAIAATSLIALLVLAGCGSSSTSSNDTTTSGSPTNAQTTTTKTRDAKEKATQAADAALERGKYAAAVAAVAALHDNTLTARYKEKAAQRLRSAARRALTSGSATEARKLALRAQAYDPTAQGRALASAAQSKVTAQRQAAKRKLQEKRAAEERKKAQNKQSKSSSAASNVEKYAGKTCSEIGHSFEVPPGADPDHDADGDGIACESE
jgi:colicin import membrane protein